MQRGRKRNKFKVHRRINNVQNIKYKLYFDLKATVKAPLPVPPQLLAIAPQLGQGEPKPNVLRQSMTFKLKFSYTSSVSHINMTSVLTVILYIYCMLICLAMPCKDSIRCLLKFFSSFGATCFSKPTESQSPPTVCPQSLWSRQPRLFLKVNVLCS